MPEPSVERRRPGAHAGFGVWLGGLAVAALIGWLGSTAPSVADPGYARTAHGVVLRAQSRATAEATRRQTMTAARETRRAAKSRATVAPRPPTTLESPGRACTAPGSTGCGKPPSVPAGPIP